MYGYYKDGKLKMISEKKIQSSLEEKSLKKNDPKENVRATRDFKKEQLQSAETIEELKQALINILYG